MPAPEPPVSLEDSCSAIHNKTLYVYTPEAFLSISLEQDAQWKKLEMGVKVTGAACVRSTSTDSSQATLSLVGGRAESNSYTGLQEYSFSAEKWTIPEIPSQDIQNRLGHSASPLEASKAIVVFGGNIDSPAPSKQTFAIVGLSVSGYLGDVPPAEAPPMLPWSPADVAMITGRDDAKGYKIFLFNPNVGWRDSGVSFKLPPEDTVSRRYALSTEDDGSKVLFVFGLKESATSVRRIPLKFANGDPVRGSSSAARRDLVHALPKRASTSNTLPEYNSTFAPKGMGKGASMTVDQNGLMVFASKKRLEFFDAKGNSWLNPTEVLGEQAVLSSTATSTPTASATAATGPSIAAASPPTTGRNKPSGPGPNTLLAITLGSILGFMALLCLFLLLLRRRKRRRRCPETDEKDPTNASPAGPAAGQFHGHYPKSSRESWSSMAILMGRVGKDRPSPIRRLSNGSSRSSVSSVHKILKSNISKPIPQSTTHPALAGLDEKSVAFVSEVDKPRPRSRNAPADGDDSTRRSSGWDRYWSGGSALQMLGLGGEKRSTAASEQSSHFSGAGKVRRDSATVPPLNLDRRPEVNKVASGHPTMSQQVKDVPSEGMAGKIERPASRASSGYSSGIADSIKDAWDPTEAAKTRGGEQTMSTSAYAPSYYFGSLPAPGRPGPPSGVSRQPQLAMAATSSDMSWFNLGNQAER